MATEQTTRPQDINDKKWYKSAKLPWGFIAVVTILGIGILVGWTLRSDANAYINSEVAKKFEASKASQQK